MRKTSKKTKDPRGREMLQQLSEFEMNHYNKLRELSKSLQEKGEWILYSGTSIKRKALSMKPDKMKGQDQLTDMDALKLAIRRREKGRSLLPVHGGVNGRPPRERDVQTVSGRRGAP